MTRQGSKERNVTVEDGSFDAFHDRMNVALKNVGGVTNMANITGFSSSVIRKWRAGQSEPTRGNLVKLAEAAGLSVGWLAAGEGPLPVEMKSKERAAAETSATSPRCHASAVSSRYIDDSLQPAALSLPQPFPPAIYVRMIEPLHSMTKSEDEREWALLRALDIIQAATQGNSQAMAQFTSADLCHVVAIALAARRIEKDERHDKNDRQAQDDTGTCHEQDNAQE